MTILAFIVLLVFIGVVAFLINKAPFIDGQFKVYLNYGLLVLGVLVTFVFVAGLFGVDTGLDLQLR